MSFLKGIIDSFGSIFSSDSSLHEPQLKPSTSSSQSMEGVTGTSVSNERIAYKLKGFFDLAKEEIAKAVRAEEWGLVDDAILHYKNAHRILIEASSTPAPSYISSSEQEKVRSYRQKISKWQGQVSERLQILNNRSGGTFVNKIDSIMSTRLANENDASRRLKSEFLIQFDGVTSNPNDLVIVIGATNKPQELDDAVLRRLVKRIYVPLPDENVRRLLLKHQLRGQTFSLPGRDLERLVRETEGYSGSDLRALCEEAAMMPIRELGASILTVQADQVRALRYEDFQKAMTVIRPSLNKSRWEELERWNEEFGAN